MVLIISSFVLSLCVHEVVSLIGLITLPCHLLSLAIPTLYVITYFDFVEFFLQSLRYNIRPVNLKFNFLRLISLDFEPWNLPCNAYSQLKRYTGLFKLCLCFLTFSSAL